VNQHIHWYLNLLELGLIVPIFNLVNTRFGLQDPDLDLHWDINNAYKSPQKIGVFAMLVVPEELKH
jgi:hypothetical protein